MTRHALFLVSVLATQAGADPVQVAPGGDIQAAILEACAAPEGAGRRVTLAAGDHPIVATLYIACDGLILEGAGAPATRIVWSGGDHALISCPVTAPPPQVGPPAIIVAAPSSTVRVTDPCSVPEAFPDVVDDVVVRDLAIHRPTPAPSRMIPETGIGVVWTKGVRVARVGISGFNIGVDLQWSDDWTVEESRIDALVVAARAGGFGGAALAVKPHLYGGLVRANELRSTATGNGVNITNGIGAAIAHNRLAAGNQVVILNGGTDHVVQHNRAKGLAPAATFISIRQGTRFNIHHNVICDLASGVRFNPFTAMPALVAWTEPSDGNLFHHNELYGVAVPDRIVEPAYVGENAVFANHSGDAADCP